MIVQGINPGDWIEAQARELGVSVARLAREARIQRSTIFRWRQGASSPNLDSFLRVSQVIERIRGERMLPMEQFWGTREERGFL